MVIEKVLNNNAVLALDESGEQIIVCGRGIAYKKRPGESVLQSAENQVYTLKNGKLDVRLQQLLSEIPLEVLQLAEEIVTYGNELLGKRLSGSMAISLADHLHTTLQRHGEGIHLTNVMLWDIRRFYPQEFSVGLKALALIKRTFGVELPEDEAGFIAIHFVNARMGNNLKETIEVTKLMQDLTNIVKYHFNLEFDKEDVYYNRFITHLKFFSQRVLQGELYHEEDDGLSQLIQHKYPGAAGCIKRIEGLIESKYAYPLSEQEKSYLIIHVQRLVYKTKTAVR
ncbi:BglG family transcription antiterminator LicT [Enterococcus devriesei]|uniref:BglG family transcription antiterminator LicT n=1 Tax=Enterococcus devriesei TaxID=319970 RepID=UPI0028A6645B|nr:PRD domain-containing protein [Enterococcus devriesei]